MAKEMRKEREFIHYVRCMVIFKWMVRIVCDLVWSSLKVVLEEVKRVNNILPHVF